MAEKKRDESWKQWEKYRKGQGRLETAILAHPDEEPGDKSVYNYMKRQFPKKRKYSRIMPFKNYEEMGKTRKHKLNEDMLAPMDSPTAPPITNPEAPGQTHQLPQSMPTDMDIMSLHGGDKKKKKKKDDKQPDIVASNKVLGFDEFMKNKSSK